MNKWELPPKGGHMDKPSGIYFQTMSTKQIEKRLKRDDIIIIPVGSTECHGPHCPYGTDTFIATRIAEAVAERTGCTVAEPLWYGSHPYHHVGMPGTIIIPEDTFTSLIRAVIAGFWNTGFRKQILLNAHGQEYVIPTAIHQFAKKYQVPSVLVNVNWFHVIPQEIKDKAHGGPYETGVGHADEGETSVALSLLPEMINMEEAIDTSTKWYLPEGHISKAGEPYQRPLRWFGHVGLGAIEISATPEGVVGSATLADAKKAKKGVEQVLDYMIRLHDDILEKFPSGKLPPIEEITQRPPKEIEPLLKGPLQKGGRSIYTVAYPP